MMVQSETKEMIRKIKVSFIIPVYKVEAYLKKCVDSILNQEYKDIEVLLVDDGSPDRCPEMCDEYVKKDARVRVIHKQNGGLSDARNVGLRAASGDYVAFLDSDDWWCDSKSLTEIVDCITKSQADVLIFKMKKYLQRQGIYKGASLSKVPYPKGEITDIEYLMRNSIFVASACDKVVRREVLVDNNIEFVKGQLSEDIEWCCHLLSLGLKYTFLDQEVYVYRKQNETSISSNVNNRHLYDIQQIIESWAERMNSVENIPIRHFLALELVLWCAIANKAVGGEGKKIIEDMSKYFYLIKYNWYPRVAIVSRFSFLGYSLFRRIICLGYSIKKGL